MRRERFEVRAADGVRIHAEASGDGSIALLFAHGWLGSARWWDAQRDAFDAQYTVIQFDLSGHGASGRERSAHSIEAYADDLCAVANAVQGERVVLVGHSMSGAVVVEASLRLPRTSAIVLVDTLKNLEQSIPPAQVDAMLGLYRRDFRSTLEQVASKWLFAAGTPPEVKARLLREFLEESGDQAAKLLEPLYRYDVRAAARQVSVPVRAINVDLHPTDVEANRKSFRDFAVRSMTGLGHYPMLEAPAQFNAQLRAVLDELQL